MNRQLAEALGLLDSASARLDGRLGALPEERWNVRPGPGAWSAAECVAHLNLTSEAYRVPLHAALEEARALAAGRRHDGPYRRDALGWMLSILVGPMPRIAGKRRGGVKTPPSFVPSQAPPRDEVVGTFRRHQAWLKELVRDCDGLPIHRVKVVSVFVPSVRYNLYATLLIIARHQLRHLQQAEEAAATG